MMNRRLMEKASARLPAVTSFTNGLPVHLLTGKKYWYQTLFCIQSLQQHSAEKFKFVLIDDGTFDEDLLAQADRQLPRAAMISRAAVEQNLDRILPAQLYPVLRNKRQEYPHIKKLTDVHTLPHGGWKLVLDSDMLFYAEPADLINWLKNPGKPLHMLDCAECYGYPRQLMEQLTGAEIPQLLNVGAIGLNSSALNWETIENWVKALEAAAGKSYYLEQALSAMLIAGNPALALGTNHYIVNPKTHLVSAGRGVLHHYVDVSKKDYYNTAWKKLI